ncbi:MAG: glutamate synthase large subunit [Anaerolineales bacterium]|nr:glutamate synthase large subunit [Anaerolineales bacterium]
MNKLHQHKVAGYPKAQGLYHPRYEHDACGMGFVVDINGRSSHHIIQQALTVLANLNHRGAAGSEANTGDGAGISIQIPHTFLQKVWPEPIPAAGSYGVGTVFMAHDEPERQRCQQQFEQIVAQEGQRFRGWRTVPTHNASLGETAKRGEPFIQQFIIERGEGVGANPLDFERKLYVIRRRAENEIGENGRFYLPSLSSHTLVYKGMLLADQLPAYYPDLRDPDMVSGLALVHSRFSTNTFPSWERAHPYRYVIHNGEINTLRGNENWMTSRQRTLATDAFGNDLPKILPIIQPDGSDTAKFDNTLEFLTLSGRPLPLAVMMMIPEPWEKHEAMSPEKKAFYEYHSTLMEPWDGPAAMGFTDGTCVGAVLDRNGLRPSRYYVTKDGRVIMASEVGVLDIAPENVAYKGRLQPGRMFLVDTAAGRIISDEELKQQYATAQPYQAWLDAGMVGLEQLPVIGNQLSVNGSRLPVGRSAAVWSRDGQSSYPPQVEGPIKMDGKTVLLHQQAFGYTFEDLRLLIAPLAQTGSEALGSMGDDTPLAVLSQKAQPLYNYFKQLFAQVTNPPLDAIREELVTSTRTLLGSQGNLLADGPDHCHRIRLETPVLDNREMAKLLGLGKKTDDRRPTTDDEMRERSVLRPSSSVFKTAVIPTLYRVHSGVAGLEAALEWLFVQADRAIEEGANLLVLSDRAINSWQAAIPSLLATSALHHHLVQRGSRTQVSLIIESGEPREVHHFATLLGYGADAINPYLALETVVNLIDRKLVVGVKPKVAVQQFIKGTVKGIVKVMSKMGISTVQSYRGAQIFEAVGLHSRVIEAYFPGTASRIEGVDLAVVADEVKARHLHAFPERQVNGKTLPEGGRYQWREDGEPHLFNPNTIHNLQTAVRTNRYDLYQKYASDVNDQSRQLYTLRGLMRFKFDQPPVPLDEVEPAETIMRRFKSGAMSYGSISQEAHESIAIAMNRIGGKSNTGEGGEDPRRYQRDKNGDSRNSAIKQVASGRFGVTSQYLNEALEIQIKMAQGAKPGEGGQLPGHKVYPWIAKVRHATPGVGLISPPPHHDIYSIEDLAQLIYDLKNANPQARINVKLVSEVGVGTVAAGVAKGHADVILISGHDGGTGASPQTSIKHAGLPWELGLAEAQQTLLLNNLRSRVRLETDGQLKTGRDVVVAALLGAEEFGFATSPLVALGCIMMRVCHLNTCPVGIATQNPALRAKFQGKPEHVVNFMRFLAEDVRHIMAELGFRTFDEMVGATERLEMGAAIDHYKAQGLDLSNILYQPEVAPEVARRQTTQQDHGLDGALDRQLLLGLAEEALAGGTAVSATLPIRNIHRTVGTMLGSEITRRYGAAGLPANTIHFHFRGSAGQSFGAFIPNGLTLELEGDANDYLGKGLSGGKIIVRPPEKATFNPADNIIIGNVALYGATSGEAYICGVAGERFGVRNSGGTAVVEGVGDHGCEYMTGGRVVVLGSTGRNFAAGMSGGVAYVLDEGGSFASRCNQAMVGLSPLRVPEEKAELRELIARHVENTGSERGRLILANWETMVDQFVKVLPNDYARMLQAFDRVEARGLAGEEAALVAFEESLEIG